MKNKTLLSLLFALVLLVSQAVAQKSETRTPGSFSKVETGGSWDVIITKGGKDEIKLESSSLDLSKVITEVRGGKLEIKLEKGNYRDVDLKVFIIVRELESVGVSGSGSVKLMSDFGAKEFALGSSGSGVIETQQINAERLAVGMSGSGEIRVGGGRVEELTIGQSGSGDFEGMDLVAQSVKIGKSGSGETSITVEQSLTVGSSGSGNVYYRGNPTEKSIGSSGSSRVIQK
ncbi:head GIN domain-containing protein [Algoriphagus aquatilis]|uniref:Head GIN domain-containing protein n=1 Tax=Algoriphagus aquatilis TaxID=490186 RepID=A0ABW0BS01_9BACT